MRRLESNPIRLGRLFSAASQPASRQRREDGWLAGGQTKTLRLGELGDVGASYFFSPSADDAGDGDGDGEGKKRHSGASSARKTLYK